MIEPPELFNINLGCVSPRPTLCWRPAPRCLFSIWSSAPEDPPCRILSISSDRPLAVIRRVLVIFLDLGNFKSHSLVSFSSFSLSHMASVVASLSRPTSLHSVSHHSSIHVPSSPARSNASASSSKASLSTTDDGEF